MLLTRGKDLKITKSNSCGIIREYLLEDRSPVSVSVAENIKETKPHYHKKTTETYWLLKGSITVKVNDKDIIELKKEDCLVISPMERHQIIKASKRNKLVAICTPLWSAEDEIII